MVTLDPHSPRHVATGQLTTWCDCSLVNDLICVDGTIECLTRRSLDCLYYMSNSLNIARNCSCAYLYVRLLVKDFNVCISVTIKLLYYHKRTFKLWVEFCLVPFFTLEQDMVAHLIGNKLSFTFIIS